MKIAAVIWKGPNGDRVMEKFDRADLELQHDGSWLKLIDKRTGETRRLIPAHRVVVAEYSEERDKSLIAVPGEN